MSQYEAAPPAAAWTHIAARLEDDRQYASISDRLNAFEQAPPPAAWEKIASELNENIISAPTVPVVPMRPLLTRRLAVAAIVLLVAGAGWWWFAGKDMQAPAYVQKDQHSNAEPVKPAITAPQTPESNDLGVTSGSTAGQKPNAAAASPSSEHATTLASNDHILSYAAVERLPSFPEVPTVISARPLTDEKGNIIRDIDVLTTNSNYLTVMGPNGQLTRISAKFASVIRYLDDAGDTEEYLDKVIRESDTWKKRFQEWRSRIKQSSFVPSASNFFDIAAFGELIGENP